MIRYDKRFWGVCTLSRWYGSAFPRALPFSLVAAAAAGLLQHFWAERAADIWKHPYPFQTFAFIVGFMIVFRCDAPVVARLKPRQKCPPLAHCQFVAAS